MTVAAAVWRRDQMGCTPCVAQLNTPADRLAALLTVIAAETEPIVTLTHLLQLCRDEHIVLWERVSDPDCQDRVAQTLSRLGQHISATPSVATLDQRMRSLLTKSLNSMSDVPPVSSHMHSPSFSTNTMHTRSLASSGIAVPTNQRSATRSRSTSRTCAS